MCQFYKSLDKKVISCFLSNRSKIFIKFEKTFKPWEFGGSLQNIFL